MGLRSAVKGESWDVEKTKVKRERKIKGEDDDSSSVEETGCWVKFRLIGSCIYSRSKVDTSLSGISTHCDSKSTNDTSRDNPIAPVISSTTTSVAESNASTSKLEEDLKVASRLRKFTFNDLKLATRNFRPESLLGEGGFGCVFKGWIEENGTAPVKPGTGLTVAVKTLNHDGLQGHKEWLAEVSFLGDLIHPNLVKLIGYCIEDDQRLLVYEFMPRGSLENHLFRRSMPLPWSIRMRIAYGAARGLAFLHEEAERPVIYRDFKTSNILLDADYNAKLSDFGLAKDGPEGDKTHVSTRVMGTYGYAAPEYVMTGHLTSKSDVYSFGVVLLEMLTGRRSMDKNRPNGEHNLVEWARPHLAERRRFYRLIDPRLEGHFSIKGSQKAAQLAARCLSRDPKARPLMSEVVEALKPLPNLKDMASSSYYFQTMQAERVGSSPNTRNGSLSRNGQQQHSLSRIGQHPRSLSIPNGSHASPYHRQFSHNSPKTNVTKGSDYQGGGKGRTQLLNSPWDVSFDPVKDIVYVAMAGQHQIWIYNASDGSTKAFSGDGYERNLNGQSSTNTSFAQPSGISLSPDLKVAYIADSESSSIRALDLKTGGSRLLAGGDPVFSDNLFKFGDHDGVGTEVLLQHPLGVLCGDGRVYIADSYNHKIKMLDLASNRVSTIAGSGKAGFKDGKSLTAQLSEPSGIVEGQNGRLFIADTNNSEIRYLDLNKEDPELLTLELKGVQPPTFKSRSLKRLRRRSSADTVTVTVNGGTSNEGNLFLQITVPEGYHFSKEARSKFSVEMEPENQVIMDPVEGYLNPEGSAIIHYKRSSPSISVERINCKVYYCKEDEICLYQSLAFEVPFQEVIPDSTPAQILLTYLVKPKTSTDKLPLSIPG